MGTNNIVFWNCWNGLTIPERIWSTACRKQALQTSNTGPSWWSEKARPRCFSTMAGLWGHSARAATP